MIPVSERSVFSHGKVLSPPQGSTDRPCVDQTVGLRFKELHRAIMMRNGGPQLGRPPERVPGCARNDVLNFRQRGGSPDLNGHPFQYAAFS